MGADMFRFDNASPLLNIARPLPTSLTSHHLEIKKKQIVACVCSNGRGSVAACLNSLLGQTISSPEIVLNIILIDNTADGALKALPPFSAPPSKVKYVHEVRPGIPFARNAALLAARQMNADFIAFIDDDEIAPNTWIESLHATLIASGADVFHGDLIRLQSLDEAIAAADNYKITEGKQRVRKTAATNNVLFKSWLVSPPLSGPLSGPPGLLFDEALARVGGSDTEFFMRACDRGAKIVRTSHPPVFEVWNGKRDTATYALRRAWRCGASTNYRYRKNRYWLIAAPILVMRSAWRAARGSVNCARGIALYFFSKPAGIAAMHKGISSLGFAAGCVSPYFSVSPKAYY